MRNTSVVTETTCGAMKEGIALPALASATAGKRGAYFVEHQVGSAHPGDPSPAGRRRLVMLVQSDRIERARIDIVKIANASLDLSGKRILASDESDKENAKENLDPWNHPYQKRTDKFFPGCLLLQKALNQIVIDS